ncbi:MAG: tetratricopeptide repeat protein, partial [Oscillochloris sp.]|nr:tetratricopeptide repeat protein [Oscillochloris sp.]
MTTSPFSLRDTARELNMLTFVEQDLARQQQAGQIDEAFLKVLRERLNQRQHHLYNSMIEYAERAEQWHVLRALSRAHARRNPGDAQLHERAGIAALRLGRNQEALVALERAVRLGSRKFNVLYELGQLYDASGRPTEATLAWEMAIACAPNATRRIQLIEHLTRRTAAEREVAQTTVPGSVRPQLAATPARITYLRGFLAEVARAVGRLDWLPRAAEPTRSVTPAQPQPIPASEPTAPPSKPTVARQPQRTFDWAEFWSALFSERMLHALLYLGATLLVISAFIWMAFNWNRFAAPVQLAALGGITSIFYGCGWVVRSKLGLLRSGSTLIAIGAGWVAVIGWALANLLGLSPPQTWLLISAVCLPAYLATTLWLREEIFSALSAIASVNLLLAALQLVNLGQAAQGCALVVLMIGFVALVPTLRSLRDGQRLAGPPVWIAQALVPLALLYAVLALRGDWLTGPFDRHLLVGIWWLGAGHYLFSLRRLSGIAYEQALAWVAPTALL